MASDILNNGTFSVANLLPSPNEQGDCLWAQKVAQNSGFVFGRPIQHLIGFGTEGTNFDPAGGSPHGVAVDYKIYFLRTAGHNRFVGTYRGDGFFSGGGGVDPDCTYTDGFSISGDLGAYTLYTNGTAANIGSTYAFGTTRSFNVDISSYVSENSFGTFTARFYGSSEDSSASRPIQYKIGTPCACYTKWG